MARPRAETLAAVLIVLMGVRLAKAGDHRGRSVRGSFVASSMTDAYAAKEAPAVAEETVSRPPAAGDTPSVDRTRVICVMPRGASVVVREAARAPFTSYQRTRTSTPASVAFARMRFVRNEVSSRAPRMVLGAIPIRSAAAKAGTDWPNVPPDAPGVEVPDETRRDEVVERI
jgi:hypothetical protein